MVFGIPFSNFWRGVYAEVSYKRDYLFYWTPPANFSFNMNLFVNLSSFPYYNFHNFLDVLL